MNEKSSQIAATKPSESPGTSTPRDFNRLLDEQRERFEFSTAAAEIGYWFCDLPFDKLIWDARVKQHFWLAPETDVDIGLFYNQIHPEDRDRTRNAIETSIASHNRYDIEYRTVSCSGEVRWVRAIGRTAYDQSGRPIRFDGITQDVTELKLAQEALESERRRLAAVFDNVPLGLVFAEPDGRIVSGNRQAERIFRHPILFSPDVEHYGEWVSFHPDGRQVEGRDYPLARVLEDGGTHTGEFLYLCGDGKLRWVEFTGAPILDAQGRITGAIVATIEIDARKRAEQALLRSEKLAAVGRLASSISHEINNPLASVVNLLYLIQACATDSTLQSYAQTAQDELARVSHIVTHTLRFNRQTNAPQEERVSSLLESAIAIYEPRLSRSGTTIARDYAEDDTVLCLPSELRQVFANLIGNAFDAVKSGGRIRVRTRRLAALPDETCVRVTIADAGCGISREAMAHLFEPFFSTKGDNGTGLGLWIAKEILSRHSARVRVKTRQAPGATGTAFSIWLPLRPEIRSSASTEVGAATA